MNPKEAPVNGGFSKPAVSLCLSFLIQVAAIFAGPAAAGATGGGAGREGLVDQVGNLVLGDRPAEEAGSSEQGSGAPSTGGALGKGLVAFTLTWQEKVSF